jgi:ABC-type multidrug transport system fused ATPase/permease subunit
MKTLLREFKQAFFLFPLRTRRRVLVLALIQSAIGCLDLAGVAAMGLLGALSVTGVQSRGPGERVTSALQILNLEDFSFQGQIVAIALSALLLLIIKTLISVYVTNRTMQFLARQGAYLSKDYLVRLLGDAKALQSGITSQKIVFSLTEGIQSIALRMIASAVGIISDVSLVILLFFGMFFLDPLLAIATLLSFSAIGLYVYRATHLESAQLGKLDSQLSIERNEQIQSALNLYRELVVLNARSEYSERIGRIQLDSALTSARLGFIPYIGKYVIEASLLVVAVLIAGMEFFVTDAVHAIAAMSVFLAAGSRIAPAMLRLQQNATNVRISTSQASPTFELIKTLAPIPKPRAVNLFDETFDASIKVENVSFTYPSRFIPSILNVNFEILSGQHVAIVGPSGSGKSTLVDLILGVVEPDLGSVEISGLDPKSTFAHWPGKVGYVPQNVVILNGNIRTNLVLASHLEVDDSLILETLSMVGLRDFVLSLPSGIETVIHENGKNLSGGQRQRLGIARALLASPQLLILDEATSSLDSQTENEITKLLSNMSTEITLISIAHRLSSVKSADLVIYIEDGKVKSKGSFEFVRNEVPDFDSQAKLLGL